MGSTNHRTLYQQCSKINKFIQKYKDIINYTVGYHVYGDDEDGDDEDGDDEDDDDEEDDDEDGDYKDGHEDDDNEDDDLKAAARNVLRTLGKQNAIYKQFGKYDINLARAARKDIARAADMYCKQVLHSYFNSDDVVFDLDKLKKIVTNAAPGYMYN